MTKKSVSSKRSNLGVRMPTVKLHKARGRSTSSQRWLQRQLNDPYVHKAKILGYRSRAAFKLAELDDKWHFLKPGKCIVDLGAAPGGWSQVAQERTSSNKKSGLVFGIDLLPIDPLPGVIFIEGDFLDETVVGQVQDQISCPVHVVLSDMAAPSSGHAPTDHIRTMALAEAAFAFACTVLVKGGSFVAKTLRGGTEQSLLILLKKKFSRVVHAKPPSSRSDSAEMYVLALDFRP